MREINNHKEENVGVMDIDTLRTCQSHVSRSWRNLAISCESRKVVLDTA